MQGLPTILVVEDDQLIQSVVEEALTEAGFETEIASSAAQAIELLDRADGKYRALGVRPPQRRHTQPQRGSTKHSVPVSESGHT